MGANPHAGTALEAELEVKPKPLPRPLPGRNDFGFGLLYRHNRT